jgi:hypothetical protein
MRLPPLPKAAVPVASCLWLGGLELAMRTHTRDGVHYQKWTSDAMMQTLPIDVLRDAPLDALYYLHIQPPMLDVIRSIFARAFPVTEHVELVRNVDICLSALYVVLYGLLSFGIYQWTRRLTNKAIAVAAWLAWLIYPAPMLYATFMEGTFLSTFFIFFFFYELWRLKKRDGSIVRLTLLTLILFFTRPIFQWYFFPLVFVSLLLRRVSARQLALFGGASVLFVSPYLVKQKLLFDTLSTTTFAGYFEAGICWYEPPPNELQAARDATDYRYPEAALRYQGYKDLNAPNTVLDNLVYPELTSRHCRMHFDECAKNVAKSLSQNVNNYWRASALHTPNGLTDNLFWASAPNWLLSGLRYQLLVAIAVASSLASSTMRWITTRRAGRPRLDDFAFQLSLAIPVALIVATTLLANRGRWIEADRLKFFLEPLFFVFWPASVDWLGRGAVRRSWGHFERHAAEGEVAIDVPADYDRGS